MMVFKEFRKIKYFAMGILSCVIATFSFAIPVENFNVTVQNNYAYSASRTFLYPSTNCFSQLPSTGTLSPGGVAFYDYIPGLCGLAATQKQATANYFGPMVTYELDKDTQHRGCQFYFGSSGPGKCDAPMPTQTSASQGSLTCGRCQATYNSEDNSCTYMFSIGSNTCSTSAKR